MSISFLRYCFPFGRPEGALKATLSLLERVLMKDIVTPVPPEEVRSTIKKSLENAALDNYTRLSAEAKIEGENASCPMRVFICSTEFYPQRIFVGKWWFRQQRSSKISFTWPSCVLTCCSRTKSITLRWVDRSHLQPPTRCSTIYDCGWLFLMVSKYKNDSSMLSQNSYTIDLASSFETFPSSHWISFLVFHSPWVSFLLSSCAVPASQSGFPFLDVFFCLVFLSSVTSHFFPFSSVLINVVIMLLTKDLNRTTSHNRLVCSLSTSVYLFSVSLSCRQWLLLGFKSLRTQFFTLLVDMTTLSSRDPIEELSFAPQNYFCLHLLTFLSVYSVSVMGATLILMMIMMMCNDQCWHLRLHFQCVVILYCWITDFSVTICFHPSHTSSPRSLPLDWMCGRPISASSPSFSFLPVLCQCFD